MVAVPQTSPLVGRRRELDAVVRAVAAATRGDGGCLLVTGEAGIGKSRLLAEAARVGREAGMVVLAGSAVEDGGPFRPLAEALLGHLRDGEDVESPQLRPFRPHSRG